MVTAADTLKNVMLTVHTPGGETELLGVSCANSRIARSMTNAWARARIPPTTRCSARTALRQVPVSGQGLYRSKSIGQERAFAIVDPRIVDGTRWITGSRRPGQACRVGLVAGRDFSPDQAEVRDGDMSPDGAGPLVSAPRHRNRPHLPARGRKYTDAFDRLLGEGRQAGAAHQRLLRDWGVAAGGGDRRATP